MEERISKLEEEQKRQSKALNELEKDFAIILSDNKKNEQSFRTVTKSLNSIMVSLKTLPNTIKLETQKETDTIWRAIQKKENEIAQMKAWADSTHHEMTEEIAESLKNEAKAHIRTIWTIFVFMFSIIMAGFYVYMGDMKEDIQTVIEKLDIHSNQVIKNGTKLESHLDRHGNGIFLKPNGYRENGDY